MSELIAEARVLVTPDTTGFRAALESQLRTAAAGITVPIPVTPVFSGGNAAASAAGLVATQNQIASATQAATGSLRLEQLLLAQGAADLSEYAAGLNNVSDAEKGADEARKRARKEMLDQERRLRGLSSGAASSALQLVGLRGATLAATGPFLAGAAAAITFSNALKTFAGFEEQLNVLQVTTGATAEEMERVSEVARRLGADVRLPGVSASDAALAMTEFAKAGLTINEAIAATPGALQLASAAQLQYAEAVNLTASALNAFDLAGTEAVHVADVLANAANAAQGGIADTALALRQAAGAAAVVGVSFEETTALLTLLARNGLVGSDAGTALRTAFLRLVNPSKEANEILEKLNINLRDINGNVRPEVFAEFAEAQRGLSAAQQQANAAIVFGQDAFRAFGFLGREGVAGLNEVAVALDKQGTASEIAAARAKGLSGEARGLSSNLETLGLTLGEVVAPAAESFLGSLNLITTGLNKGAEAARNFLSGDDFSSQDANLRELAARLEEVNGEIEDLRRSGGEGLTGALEQEAAGLTDQMVKLGKELADTPQGFLRVQAAFASGSPVIKAALQDGVITPLEQAEIATTSLGRAFLKTFKIDVVGTINTALAGALGGLKEQMETAGEEAAKAFGDGFASAAAQLDLDLAVAEASGNEDEQLNILREREQRQEAFLQNVLKRPQNAKNVALATKAAENLAATRRQIAAIVQKQQSEARADAEKVRANAAAADRTFLDGLSDAREDQENALAAALTTPGTKDDIREAKELRTLIQQQINLIRQSTLDEETKQDAIRALTRAKIATTAQIKNLQKAEKEQNAQTALELAGERLALRTQIAEARGDEDAVLAALDRQIANQRKQVKAAKDIDELLQEQLELEQLLAKKRELIAKQREDQTGGKSLAEFLTENTDLFARTASNIGTVGIDPLSGFDFSQSIVATTKRLQEAQKVQQTQSQTKEQQNRLPDAIDRLIAALDANTAATQGNTSTSGGMNKYATVTGQRAQAMADFWQAQQARNMEQARFDGGGGV